MVVESPWPVSTMVSEGKLKRVSRMERTMVG